MTAFESQMAAQRSLMTDAGLGMNTGQSDGLMHHPLAMVQNQNRKSFFQLSLFQPSTLNCLCALLQYLAFPNRTGRTLYYESSYYDLNFTMQRVELQYIGAIKSGAAGQIFDQIAKSNPGPVHLRPRSNYNSLSSVQPSIRTISSSRLNSRRPSSSAKWPITTTTRPASSSACPTASLTPSWLPMTL